MSAEKPTPHFNTLTDRVRYHTSGLTTWLGRTLWRAGIHPDWITATGLVIVAVAALVVSQGHFFWAGVILLLGMPLDALDGAVARAMARTGKFGAFFDSTLDRYADGFLFMAFAYYFTTRGSEAGVLLSVLALLGSVLVSYTRARAEGLDVECKVGLLTRMERVGILLAMLLTGWVLPGLWILVIGTHITVLQRIVHVYRQLRAREAAQ